MNIRNRRDFLKASLSSISALSAGAALAKFGELNAYAQVPAGSYNALVCIFLLGGNDGHNTVIPISTPNGYQNNPALYTANRLSLALPQASLHHVATKSGDIYGLHPKLTELQGLYNSGNAAILANVGMLAVPIANRAAYLAGAQVPANLFSHSDQTSQWQTTVPNGLISSGWGGRLADYMQPSNSSAAFPAVATTSGCGIFCNGQSTFSTTVPPSGAISLSGLSDPAILQGNQQLLSFDNGLKLVQSANGVVNRGQTYANALNGLIGGVKINTPFPATGLGSQLGMVAKLISLHSQLQLSRQVFFCTLGGFDTHGGELATQDALFSELSPAIKAFYDATTELNVQNQVTTFTNSEFGRTVMPNSSGGTDHAWGSHHFVIGGAVKGADMYGKFPLLALNGQDDANNRGTIIPSTSVAQYAATLAKWFGVVDPNSLSQVIPSIGNFGANIDLGFLG